MDPQLRNFVRDLVQHSIRAAIHSVFWKMPLIWTLLLLAALIGAAIYFRLY